MGTVTWVEIQRRSVLIKVKGDVVPERRKLGDVSVMEEGPLTRGGYE